MKSNGTQGRASRAIGGAGIDLRRLQRAEILRATAQAARDLGCGGVTVAEVTARAGVSRRAFYQIFSGRDDCLLAALRDGLERAERRVVAAYEAQAAWRDAIRAGLAELLLFLDEEPDLAAFMIVHSPGAGEEAVRCHVKVLAALVDAVDDGRAQSGTPRSVSRVTAEGAVGAVMAVLHTRLLSRSEGLLSEQLGPLMSLIVLPYLGPVAAAEEQDASRGAPCGVPRSAAAPLGGRARTGSLANVKVRLTHRTAAVLRAVAERPRSSNREIAQLAGIWDQGQMSKLLARLQEAGLIENAAQARHGGQPNEWSLSQEGERLERAIRDHLG